MFAVTGIPAPLFFAQELQHIAIRAISPRITQRHLRPAGAHSGGHIIIATITNTPTSLRMYTHRVSTVLVVARLDGSQAGAIFRPIIRRSGISPNFRNWFSSKNRFDILVPVLFALGLFFTGHYLEQAKAHLPCIPPAHQLLVWGFFISTTALFSRHLDPHLTPSPTSWATGSFETKDDSRNGFILLAHHAGRRVGIIITIGTCQPPARDFIGGKSTLLTTC